MTNAPTNNRIELLYGTLDLLILRTLVYGPSHGHAIAKHIQRVSENALQIETGSLYPALHKLEGARLDRGRVEEVGQGQARPLLPPHPGRPRAPHGAAVALSVAMARVLRPAEQESGP